MHAVFIGQSKKSNVLLLPGPLEMSFKKNTWPWERGWPPSFRINFWAWADVFQSTKHALPDVVDSTTSSCQCQSRPFRWPRDQKKRRALENGVSLDKNWMRMRAEVSKKSNMVIILVPRATIILTCGRDRELWLCPTPEVRDSRTSRQIWKSDWLRIWNDYSAHAQKIGSGQNSRSLPQIRRIVALGTRMYGDVLQAVTSYRFPTIFDAAKLDEQLLMPLDIPLNDSQQPDSNVFSSCELY